MASANSNDAMDSLQNVSIFGRALFACALVAIVLGVFFRIHALDRPLFWQDETTTALRVTGHDAVGYGPIYDGKIHAIADVHRYLEVDPGKTPIDVAAALAREDPQHVPLYYMIERIWIGVFGTSIVGLRGLSVLCGIATIALAFALVSQLAGRRAGAVAASLVALSPLFILMSRQAREYALFSDTILISTIVLVRALRDPRDGWKWLWYALSVVAGVYSDTLFVLAVLGHGIATLATSGARSRAVVSWLVAAIAGGASLVPWLVASSHAGNRAASEEAWIKSTYSLKIFVAKSAFNFGALGFDGEYASLKFALLAVVAILGLSLAIAAGLRFSKGLARVIPAALALPTFVILGCIDLVAHAHFVTIPRYLVATWVGCDLCAAIGIAAALERTRFRVVSVSCWIVLLVLGASAATIRGGAENWWDDGEGMVLQTLARSIDATPNPLVVVGDRWNVPLELSLYVRPDARVLLFREPRTLAPGTTAFVIAPTAGELAVLAPTVAFHRKNVSPENGTALDALSHTAHGYRTPADAGDAALRPDNALWLVTPR